MTLITNLSNIGGIENQLLIGNSSLAVPRVRQCVLQGSLDSAQSHYPPNFLSAGSGTNVTGTASSSVPLIVTFANGFHNPGSGGVPGLCLGQLNYTVAITSNLSWPVGGSSTGFLYLDYNPATGAITTGVTYSAPVYSRSAPSSPVLFQHWFNTATHQMFYYNSGWIQATRVYVGECVTSSSAITSVTTYAYGGRYETSWLTVGTGVNISFAHNMGMDLSAACCTPNVFGRVNSSDTVPELCPPYININGYYGLIVNASIITNPRIYYGTQTGNLGVYTNGTAWYTTADLKAIFLRGW